MPFLETPSVDVLTLWSAFQGRPPPDDNIRLLGTMREKQRRLALVDRLLWGTEPTEQPSQSTRKRSGWLAALLHAVFTISLNAVCLKATKTELTLFQDTVPGPWQSNQCATGVPVVIVLGQRCRRRVPAKPTA